MQSVLLDAAGRRRSPATLPGYARGRPPRNKGLQYPADPPSVEEIISVMRCAGKRPEGLRMRALIVVLWRAGLRISEALALAESDLDPRRGSILVRCGKGGKRREVGMDAWAWEQLTPWLELRRTMPVGDAAVRHLRGDPRSAVDSDRRARTAAARRGTLRCAPAVCAASAATCPRRGDGTRRSPVGRHPALLLLAVAVLKPWRLAFRLAQALVAPGCPSAVSDSARKWVQVTVLRAPRPDRWLSVSGANGASPSRDLERAQGRSLLAQSASSVQRVSGA